jgi:hypothetical protein
MLQQQPIVCATQANDSEQGAVQHALSCFLGAQPSKPCFMSQKHGKVPANRIFAIGMHLLLAKGSTGGSTELQKHSSVSWPAKPA